MSPRTPETIAIWSYCISNPGAPQCDYLQSLYPYRLSLGANATLLALFLLSLVGFVAVYVLRRRAVAFTVALTCGVILEILGYIGRVMSWKNQWDINPFLMQICCLTIGPAFFAGGIYLCLRRIVSAFGPQNSRIRPELYTRIFIPCDVVSLILQALGGGITSVAAQANKDVTHGTHIIIVGLAFQAFTMLAFIIVAVDFALRTWRRQRALGSEVAFDMDPTLVAMRASAGFRFFLAAITVATVCIFWRSIFRVAELSEGWNGSISSNQALFISFEGGVVVIASLALNLGHPALCARPLFEGKYGQLRGLWGTKGRRNPPPPCDTPPSDAEHSKERSVSGQVEVH